MFKVSDINALKQAIQELGVKRYKVIRNISRGFNKQGRVDNIKVETYVNAIIQPSSKTIEMNSEGNGEWITSEFQAFVVNPDYICFDDIFVTNEFGNLRVASVTDNRFQGTMSAQLVRENSAGTYLMNQENI